MSLADKIIKIRLDNNLSKEEFANELFVTVMDVEKWEQGYSVPDEGMLNVIAFKFNVPFDYLLEKKVENNFSDESKKPLGIRSNAFCVSSIFGLVILSFAMVFMIMALITAEEDFPFMIIFILIFGGISIYFLYISSPKPCSNDGSKFGSSHTCPSPLPNLVWHSICFLRKSLKKITVNGIAKKKAKISEII